MRLTDVESIRQPYAHLYLSPHMDDAVLSCGGRIALQTGRGERVLVVTAFSGNGEGAASHEIPGVLTRSDLSTRREEEETALGRLGADFLLLNYPDGVFRCRHPLLRYGLHLSAARRFSSLVGALRSDLDRVSMAASCRGIYLPLGIGQHIDHHLAFLAGINMSCEPGNSLAVSFYEEFPYALIPHALHYRFRIIGAPAIPPPAARRRPEKRIIDIHRSVSHISTLTGNRPLGKLAVLLGLAGAIVYLETAGRISRRAAVPCLLPEKVDFTPHFERKLAAIMDYRSQAQLFFGSAASLKRSLSRYSLDMGGAEGHYLERYWHVPKAG